MRDERDGVELEISSDAEKLNEQNRRKASRGVHKKTPTNKKLTTAEVRALREEKLKKMEEEYQPVYMEENIDKSFYVYGLLLAVVVCIVTFYVIFMFTADKTSGTNNNGNNITSNVDGENDIDSQLQGEYKTITGYITAIDSENKTISVLNIENGEVLEIVVASSTAINDEYGRALVFSELTLGDGVEINYIRANNMAVSIDKPEAFFTKSEKTGVVINPTTKMLTYNEQSYYATDYTVVVNQDGEPIGLGDISEKDVITFKGISNYVNYIEVLTGHGTIQFTNIDMVKNPKVEINTKTIVDLSKETSAVVTEGSNKVVITGDNITPFVQYITVESGETVNVDLSLATGKLGNLFVVSNVDGIILKINDKEYDETKPITLPYGDYVATASKLNYTSDTVSFTINKPSTNAVFNLVPEDTNVILEIATTPVGAEVFVDNQLIGVTPIKFSTTQGTHQVTVKYPGKYDYAFTIDGSELYYRYNYTLIDKPVTPTEEVETETETETETTEETTPSE